MTGFARVGRRGLRRASAALTHREYGRLLLARTASAAANGLLMVTAPHAAAVLPERQRTTLAPCPGDGADPAALLAARGLCGRLRPSSAPPTPSRLDLPAAARAPLASLADGVGIGLVATGMVIAFSAHRLVPAIASSVVGSRLTAVLGTTAPLLACAAWGPAGLVSSALSGGSTPDRPSSRSRSGSCSRRRWSRHR